MFRLWIIFAAAQSAAALITFVISPMNETVLQGGTVLLRCTAAGNGVPHISWHKDGDIVSADRFHFDTQSGILSLPLVQCDDAGWYNCMVSNGSETAVRRAYLTVLCGTAPSFVRALPLKHSFTNVRSLADTVVVQCYARGNPPPDVRWEKERRRLPSSPTTEGPYAIGGSLHLVSSQPRDSGVYCCVAENELGTAAQNTTVTIVEEAPPLWLSWWMLSLYCAVVIVALLSVPLCCKLTVEGCRKRAEDEDLVDSQTRGPWGMVNPGANPPVVLTSTRESFFHEGGELGMFASGEQAAFQGEVMGRGKEEVLVGWKEEDVAEQITDRADVANTLEREKDVGEVLEERLVVELHEERPLAVVGEAIDGRKEVIEDGEERREGTELSTATDRKDELQGEAVVVHEVTEVREEGDIRGDAHTVMREDSVKVERSLHRRSQVESHVYEFTFDQCDSDDTQDSDRGAEDKNKMLN